MSESCAEINAECKAIEQKIDSLREVLGKRWNDRAIRIDDHLWRAKCAMAAAVLEAE